MARVHFELTRRFEAPVRRVWDELVDWPGHGAWIPATKVEAEPGDPTEVGYTFTAWSGVRPVALEDRMRVTRCDWDDAASTGICDVDKLGPILGGSAGFTVRPDGAGTMLALARRRHRALPAPLPGAGGGVRRASRIPARTTRTRQGARPSLIGHFNASSCPRSRSA